ncbi:MAG: polysaccharide lyase [Nodosilinea sp.]
MNSASLLTTTAVSVLLSLSSCSAELASQEDSQASLSVPTPSPSPASSVNWAGSLTATDWLDQWGAQDDKSWGLDSNIVVMDDPDRRFEKIMRVAYPAGSASPSVSRESGVAIGGAQFYADLPIPDQDQLTLSYFVRFSEDFDFVKGGKLPGLYGGTGASGGNVPDGTDGFSTRIMWRREGDGEMYAYLPTSEGYGDSIGRGSWRFQPGVWHHLKQTISLNDPQAANGRIQVWVDGKPVIDQSGLVFRSTTDLKIDGLFFSTFFGGGDPSWATPQDVYADFAEFTVTAD